MPIFLSDKPGQSKIVNDSEEVIRSVSEDAKLGPSLPYEETHPIQFVGRNITATGEILPRVVTTVTASADMTMQAISNRFMSLLPTISSLPAWSDDITERFGPEIYERMYKDSEVSASLDMLVSASTSQGIRFIPAISASGGPLHKKSQRIADFFTWMISDYITDVSFDEVRTSSILNALKYGHNISEMTFGAVPDGKYRNHIALQTIRDATIREYSIVVDNFNNVIGVIPAVNRVGIGSGTEQFIGSFLDNPHITINDITSSNQDKQRLVNYFRNSLVPRQKFIFYTWRPVANDPRGTSAIRSAYTAWWLKQQITNEMLSWLEKFSQPSIVGTTPESAQEICEYDAAGNVISRITPTNQLLTQLRKFQNSSAIAVPFGTKVNLLTSTGQGQVFLAALQYANQEIARAILKQHLATSEGIHQSRAASTVHQDILSLIIISIKNWQIRTLMRDFVRPLTILNFGPESLKLAPKIDIGDGDGFPLNPFEVSQLQGVQWFSPSQFSEIDRLLGLPIRSESPEEILAHYGGSLQEDEAVFDEKTQSEQETDGAENDDPDD